MKILNHMSCIWIAACCSTTARINVDRSSAVVRRWRATSFLGAWPCAEHDYIAIGIFATAVLVSVSVYDSF